MWFGCPCLSCVSETVAEHGWGTSGWGLTQLLAPLRAWAPVYMKDQRRPFLSFFPLGFLVFVFFFTKSFFIMIRRRRNFELSWPSSRTKLCLPPSLKADEGWAQRLTLGCVSVHSMRCQSILHMAMFGYKKDTAMRYSRLLNDHFKVGHRYH